MDEEIYQILEEIGIEEKPTQVYMAALQLGGDTAANIAKKSGIERVNTYYILDQLVHKGLVYTAKQHSSTIFVAHSPKKLEVIAENRLSKIKKLLPELLSIENTSGIKPKVRYYEGIEGIKQLFEETLDLPKGSETLAYSSHSLDNKYIAEYLKEYIPRRVAKGITQRCIIEYSTDSLAVKTRDSAELRESRIVNPEYFPFSNQINIFGNKMFIASYKDMIGVIIESYEITKTQRSIFELAWLGAERVMV